MVKVLVAAGSKTGGTAEMAEWIANRLGSRGVEVDLMPAGSARPKGHDAAVVGSALYAGRWRRPAVRLLKRLARSGDGMPVWLFHSGPLGDDNAEEPQKPPGTVARLAEEMGAEDVVTFGGCLDDSAGGFIANAMKRNGMEGDWRDRDQVEAWADSIADRLLNA